MDGLTAVRAHLVVGKEKGRGENDAAQPDNRTIVKQYS
jgi:hypothetical protein